MSTIGPPRRPQPALVSLYGETARAAAMRGPRELDTTRWSDRRERGAERQIFIAARGHGTPDGVGAPRDVVEGAGRSLSTLHRHLNRCALAASTVRAYARQVDAYTTWLLQHRYEHPDAYRDHLSAESAVSAWRHHLLDLRAAAATINQAMAAVTLMYQLIGLRIRPEQLRVARSDSSHALTKLQCDAVQRVADHRGPRDAALLAVLLNTGPRVAEAVRMHVSDVVITAQAGHIRFVSRVGDRARTVPVPAPVRSRLRDWLEVRGGEPGPMWWGQRGALSTSGITQVVLAVGAQALGRESASLRPQRLRHTYATRLKQGGADAAQYGALLGYAGPASTPVQDRASATDVAAVVERIFD